jgi:hypothetical protein
LFEELKNKYPAVTLSLYGDSLIIPQNEFKKEWEKTLTEEGHAWRLIDYDRRMIFAISLKHNVPYIKEPFPEPPPQQKTESPIREIIQQRARGGNRWKNVWQPKEDELLIILWNQEPKLTVQKITAIFQKTYSNRTDLAIGNRISALQVEERIPRRIGKKAPKTPKPEKEKPKHWNEIKENPNPEPQEKRILEEVQEVAKKLISELSDERAKQLVEFDLRILTLERAKAELEVEIEFLRSDFKEHEHSRKTGLPLVPP